MVEPLPVWVLPTRILGSAAVALPWPPGPRGQRGQRAAARDQDQSCSLSPGEGWGNMDVVGARQAFAPNFKGFLC